MHVCVCGVCVLCSGVCVCVMLCVYAFSCVCVCVPVRIMHCMGHSGTRGVWYGKDR